MKQSVNILIITIIILHLSTSCETKGDMFETFPVKEIPFGNFPDHAVKNICFLNKNSGFISFSKDTIMKTTDGCKSFTVSLAKPFEVFNVIRFINDKVGFVAGNSNLLYKTIDGGQTWQQLKLQVSINDLTDLVCLNADTIFVASSTADSTTGGYIFKTIDGGKSWVETPTNDILKLCFVNDHIGFACGNDGIMKTIDGGITWQTVSKQSATEIVFSSDNEGYVVFHRTVYGTHDGGKSWNTIKEIVDRHWVIGVDDSKIESLQLFHHNEILFTLNSKLLKVSNNGLTWRQYEFTRPYIQLQMMNADTGFIYGYQNLIMVTF